MFGKNKYEIYNAERSSLKTDIILLPPQNTYQVVPGF